MRRSLLVFVALCCGYALHAQKPMSIKIKDPVICYAGTENHPHYVAPPQEYLKKAKGNASHLTNSTVIEVEYIGFENVPQAQAAFQRAVDIWSGLLTTSVPIRIQVRWVTLAANVLGSANYTAAFANFKGAQKLNVFYPVALAEKISGNNLNGDDPDIFANFNSNFDWHFDPDDTNVPAGKYDLTTVVLHEIGHGLGFSGTFTSASGQGQYGLLGSGVPIVYDAFLQNNVPANLIATVTSPSAAMRTELISNSLFFSGPSGVSKIYAPGVFNGGSSISHLDESTFNETDDALMTPQIAPQERIRNPGLALEILKDLGWEMIHINHFELPDSEDLAGPFTVTASIDAANGYNENSVTLHHTLNGTLFTEVAMVPQGNDTYTAFVPSENVERQYGYFISVENDDGAVFTNPGTLVRLKDTQFQLFNVFTAGPDTEDPIITHIKKLYVLESETELEVNAIISDNIGSVDATLEYSINDVDQDDIIMSLTAPGEDSVYTATINFTGLSNGDEIKYRIIAIDRSSNNNQTISPQVDEYKVGIVGFASAQATYQTTFASEERDEEFFGDGFIVSMPDGFESRAIHSEHPYESGAGSANDERELIYQLRIPITVASSDAFIRFDEIVLVEPGATGSVFGDPDFFDYVIVEGSIDQGETWEPLASGYDARDNGSWLTRYNSNVNAQGNSLAVGIPSLYKPRQINILNTFDAGDEILIRFRMYIDELASGWGWAIDNLAIQSVITSIENTTLETGISVYPNPATEEIIVEAEGNASSKFSVELLTTQGQKIYEANGQVANGKMAHTIAASQLSAGMYLVRISNGTKSAVRKVIKIN
jgi:Secretion system C-terminal sorting domain